MEQLYKATFDHSVSGVSWKSGDGEYKEMFPTPINMMSGDTLEITLDPSPAGGEYFVHVVVGGKNEIKGIVAPKVYSGSLKYHWGAGYSIVRPHGIDKFDYLLEEA
jgi:hypothetical protein